MKPVERLLKIKGREVFRVHPDASVLEALQTLADKDVGALLVMEDERLVGLFSERDYARKIILHGKTSRDSKVREVMSTQVLCIPPSAPVEEAMALMTEQRVRHLPVVDEGKVVGVISIGDVVKDIISDQEFHIQQLENYIMTG